MSVWLFIVRSSKSDKTWCEETATILTHYWQGVYREYLSCVLRRDSKHSFQLLSPEHNSTHSIARLTATIEGFGRFDNTISGGWYTRIYNTCVYLYWQYSLYDLCTRDVLTMKWQSADVGRVSCDTWQPLPSLSDSCSRNSFLLSLLSLPMRESPILFLCPLSFPLRFFPPSSVSGYTWQTLTVPWFFRYTFWCSFPYILHPWIFTFSIFSFLFYQLWHLTTTTTSLEESFGGFWCWRKDLPSWFELCEI